MIAFDNIKRSKNMKHFLSIFRRYKSLIFFGLSVLCVFLLLAACAAPSIQTPKIIAGHGHSHATNRALADIEVEKRLRQEYRRWRGTRHRLGGSGRGGIDCSGFVRAVYKDVFNIDLARSTQMQVRQGQTVSYKNLRSGDLVFFRPPSYPRHVGIYLGGGEFVHASKNKGVTVSRIDQTYWGKYYWTARRILPESQHP